MPLFSVIVPVYNVENYLTECIDSILAQSYPNFEVILVDDGSKDGSPAICDVYQEKDPRIKVIHKENGGVVSARKVGAENAIGEYILNVDSDDYIALDFLETIYAAIMQSDADIIAIDHIFVSEEGKKVGSYRNPLDAGVYKGALVEQLKDRLLYDFNLPYSNYGCLSFSLCSKAIRKELYQPCQQGIPNGIRMGDDLAVSISAISQANSLHMLRYEGYFYRQRKSSIIHTFDPNEIGRIELLVEYMKASIPQIPEKNMAGYIINLVMDHISKGAATLKCYREFADHIKEKCLPMVRPALSVFCHKGLRLADRLKLWCLRKRMWRIFWWLYRNR